LGNNPDLVKLYVTVHAVPPTKTKSAVSIIGMAAIFAVLFRNKKFGRPEAIRITVIKKFYKASQLKAT